NGKDAAILSKKLATIITNVPVAFHEEDFKLKDWNRELLMEVFTSLEFRTIAQRILGETLPVANRNAGEKVTITAVQTDLFGNTNVEEVSVSSFPEKKQTGKDATLTSLPEG